MAFENIITNDMTCDTLAHHLDINSLGRLCLCNRQTHSTVLRAMKAAVHPDVTSLPVTPRWTDSEKKYLQQLKSNMSLAPFRKETLTILWNDLSQSSSVTTPDCKKKHIEWLRIIVPLFTIGNMAHHTQKLTLTLDQGPFTLRLEDPTTHDIYGVICNSLSTRIGEFHANGFLKNGRVEYLPKIENKFKKFSEGEFFDNGTLKNGRREYEPNAQNKFIKFVEGKFRNNGTLKNGRLEFEPKIENKFIKFRQGDFHANGKLKNGRIEYLPKIENKFTKFQAGDFHVNGNFKNGRIEFEPKIENRFIKFRQGDFHANGKLKNGRIEWVPNAVNVFIKSVQGEFHANEILKNGTIHIINPDQTIEKTLLAYGSYVITIANNSLESLASIEKIVYSPQGAILNQQSPTDHLFSVLPLGLKRFLGIV